ncbi:MAG: type II toxin-antitoxin system prevent-host-death family antitoxin [Acidobacteria bacterium]|nr:MAG: type II toxin-antitoxin system prevent-host-death family antitoxin [Acidobacteriota bacterium]
MALQVNVHFAKTHLSGLLDDVRAGHEIVLAKRGVPYAKLVPIEDPPKRDLGFVNYRVPESFFEPLPDDELELWK